MNKLLYIFLAAMPAFVMACSDTTGMINKPYSQGGGHDVDPNDARRINMPNTPGEEALTTQPAPQMNDNELRQRIRDRLAGGWFGQNFDAVNVDVSNGVVTITGIVPSDQDKQDIETRIREFVEIRQLNNQLQVNPNAPAAAQPSMNY